MPLKDRFKPLLATVSANDPVKLRNDATEALREIQGDITALNKEKAAIKELVGRYGGSADNLDSRGRTAKVREAGRLLAAKGKISFSPQELIDYLKEEESFEFAVSKPASVAGTILAQLKDEFERADGGKFKYLGNHGSVVKLETNE